MARKAIILERTPTPSGSVQYRVAFWPAVPTARQTFYADALFVSAVLDATTPEKNALTSGAMVERVEIMEYPGDTPLATVKVGVVERFATLQAELNARNPWSIYGTFWDSATNAWTDKAVS